MNHVAARISAFNQVRDLPYYIATAGEEDRCCSTKSFILQRRLASLGLGSLVLFGTFSWASLKLPFEILNKLPSDEGWHQWLSVHIPEKNTWVDVDPSWDPGLSAVLPIADWDGLSSTSLAVPLTKRCSLQESAAILGNGYQPAAVSDYMTQYREFLVALNHHFSTIRAKH